MLLGWWGLGPCPRWGRQPLGGCPFAQWLQATTWTGQARGNPTLRDVLDLVDSGGDAANPLEPLECFPLREVACATVLRGRNPLRATLRARGQPIPRDGREPSHFSRLHTLNGVAASHFCKGSMPRSPPPSWGGCAEEEFCFFFCFDFYNFSQFYLSYIFLSPIVCA